MLSNTELYFSVEHLDCSASSPLYECAADHHAGHQGLSLLHRACTPVTEEAGRVNGTNMLCAGALAGKAEPVAAVRSMHNVLGGTIDPHAAFLMLRGMKTLDVRVQRQNQACHLSSVSATS